MLNFWKNKKQTNKYKNSTGIDFIIVGLGNPGINYENSRHNAGFMALDHLALAHNKVIRRLKFKGTTCDIQLGDKRVLLLKPSTFMNLSGQSVLEAMQFYKLPPEKVLLMFDDVSLSPGKIRIRRKGSDGGQNGMKNIIYLTGIDTFPRIKLGIGAKPHPEYDLARWVLSKFTSSELIEMKHAVEMACTAAELIVNDELDRAMSQFNGA